MRITHISPAKRILASLGILGTLGAIAGFATYATFTSTTNGTQAVSTGKVSLDMATGVNHLSDSATAVAAGDTMQRAVDLTNSSSIALSDIKLSTNATTSSALNSDPVDGLQLAIDKCSVAWTETGSVPAHTYTCSGTTSSVLASRPVIGSNLALSNLTLGASGGTDRLRLTLTLPGTSNLQDLSSAIQYSFSATQRTATSR